MGITENRNKFVNKLEELGVDIDELLSKVSVKRNEAYIKMWLDAAMIGARSSLSAADLNNASVIEQIGYLFDRCPNEKKFEHMQIVPLAYLAHCLANAKLPPEEEWLRDMIERIRTRHGNYLVFEMLNVLLIVPT